MGALALLCAASPARAADPPAPDAPLDRLGVERLLIGSGFSYVAIRPDGTDWRGEGDRDGRVLRFVVRRDRIRVLDSRVGGAGPIADGP